MIKLDARLQALADFVEAGSKVADIGTDHGYLAINLIQTEKAAMVIASDKNPGPYEAAKRDVMAAGLQEKISVRLGDGIRDLAPGEADTICIAGMGGVLMTEILGAKPSVVEACKQLILQPMNGAFELRKWLYEQKWHIVDETLAVADGRIYEVISAKPGEMPMPDDTALTIGPKLLEKKPELYRHHVESLLFQEKRVAANMEKSDSAKKSEKYQKVLMKIKELEAKL